MCQKRDVHAYAHNYNYVYVHVQLKAGNIQVSYLSNYEIAEMLFES